MKKKITWFEVVLLICLIVILVNIWNYKQDIWQLIKDGGSYIKLCFNEFFFEEDMEREYGFKMLAVRQKLIKTTFDEYYVLRNKTVDKHLSKEELDELQEIKYAFLDYKKAFEAIIPPRACINTHKEVLEACQYCADSVDIYIEALNIKDEEIRREKIKEVNERIIEETRIFKVYLTNGVI